MKSDNINSIKQEIKKLENNIETIQEECDHKPTVVFNNELKSVVKVCEKCDKHLGYATQQERIENGFR